ncbi:G-protein coupled receptor 183-like [Coregonus clupeaformis]|uniref:G-protein coupled receptor 183-like n=1 Tax=Coregonus clupeaformis TaxID=59861 RepID=UPI001E1C9BC8|nr:G-protein coupled receptor 183-like [Coregonus clupeaformis]
MEDPLFLYSALNTTSLPTALPLNVMINPMNNSTVTDLMTNATFKPFNVCEEMVAGILFDLTVQTFNVILGLPANILVLVILLRNRKELSSSDIFLGCLAFMDAYFGIMVPFSYLNFYYWHSKDVWSALKFSYGVKDASGPLFLSCICLDRFVAVLFPLAYGQLKDTKYRVALSAVVLGLTFTYASAKTVGGLPNFEKVLTWTILATFAWMVFCNGAILVALKSSGGSGKDNMHPMKKKAFKIVMSVLSIIVFPFEDHYPPDTFRCLVQPVGYAFINISRSIQPIIYLSRLEKIPFLPDAWTKWCCSSNEKVKEVKVETISPA